jgi:hypothetical protein
MAGGNAGARDLDLAGRYRWLRGLQPPPAQHSPPDARDVTVLWRLRDDAGSTVEESWQHWSNGLLKSWEASNALTSDVIVEQPRSVNQRLWAGTATGAEVASSTRIRVGGGPSCHYPPTLAELTPSAPCEDRVPLLEPNDVVLDVALSDYFPSRLHYRISCVNGEWSMAFSDHRDATVDVGLTCRAADAVRLITGRNHLNDFADRCHIDGDLWLIAAASTLFDDIGVLLRATPLWRAIRPYEDFLEQFSSVDLAQWRSNAGGS